VEVGQAGYDDDLMNPQEPDRAPDPPRSQAEAEAAGPATAPVGDPKWQDEAPTAVGDRQPVAPWWFAPDPAAPEPATAPAPPVAASEPVAPASVEATPARPADDWGSASPAWQAPPGAAGAPPWSQPEPAPPAHWGVAPPPTQPGWGPPPYGPAGWGAPPPPARRPGRRRGPLLAAGAAVLVVVLLVVGLVAWPDRVPPPGRRVQSGKVATATPIAPQDGARRLLSARARAIVARDKAGFLAGIDRRRTAFYASQSRLFDNLVTAPFRDFTYRLVDSYDDLATPTLRRRYAPARIYLPETEARYRFRGHDGSPVLSRFHFTFVQTPAGWRIAGQGEAKPLGVDDVEIWDGGPLRTVSTVRTLVVYHPGDRTLANRLLRTAERAYAQIAASWSGGWERKVVILVPHDQNEAERLVGTADLSKVAAVASSSIEAGAVERVLGNRIVVNTTNINTYDTLNLQVVTTHEMTHVATRTLGSGVPLFMVEGFADYVALRPIDQPLSVTRPALAKEVAQGRFGGVLPSDEAFRASDGAEAYDEASSFCLWVATSFGNAKLQQLVRSFQGSQKPSTQLQDTRFRQILGIPERTAEARWAAWVRRQL
jgi:hypothetical protein